jgi:hypothetical protein
MRLTLWRRAAAPVAVLAATAAGLAVAPVLRADAAGPATRAATSLSIRTAHDAVRPGGSDIVTGHLGIAGPLSPAGRMVTLEAKPKGTDSFTPIGTAEAGDRGGLHESVTPDVTTRYRWHYAGDTDTRPSVSGIATVRVRTTHHQAHRINTTLSIRAAHRIVDPNGSDVITGRLRARRVPLPHRLVILVSRTADSHSWAFEGAHRTRRLGAVSFRVAPEENTAYRLVFLGSGLLQPVRSAVVRIGTRPDLTIAADPSRIDRGESTTISGVASDEGVPIVGATVKLLARKAGTHRVRAIESATTGTDGSVSITASPKVTTIYRLRLVHSPGVRASLSDATRVAVRVPTTISIRGRAAQAEFVVSGTLVGGGHALAHRRVTLQSQAPGSADWTDAGTTRTNRHGFVKFRQTVVPGTGYRLAYAGGPRFAPSTSGTVVS